jgi:RNA polymerase sigma factor (sigma-70 family)
MAADPVVLRAGRLSPEAAGARIHQLFVEHGRMVYGVCRMLLRDGHEAEDAAQQTFLSAHRSLLGGNLPREPSSWLSAIARNECRASIRERMRAPLPLDEEHEQTSEGAEQVAGRRAEIEALREAMRELPDSQREAIVLREFYGLRYDEVGAALGLSAPAVESLLFRARKRLQAELRPLRLVSGGLVVPAALREALGQTIPGFAGAGTAAAGGGALAAALAKLGTAPLAAKLAAAALAIGAAGSGVGLVEHGSSTSAPRKAQPEFLARGVMQSEQSSAPRPVSAAGRPAGTAPSGDSLRAESLLASLKRQLPAPPPEEGRPEEAGGSGPRPAEAPEAPERPAAPVQSAAPAPGGDETGTRPSGGSSDTGLTQPEDGFASSGDGSGIALQSAGDSSPEGDGVARDGSAGTPAEAPPASGESSPSSGESPDPAATTSAETAPAEPPSP